MATVLSDAELHVVIEELRRRARYGTRCQRRDATGCLLGTLGLRIEETCRLRISDIDWYQATVRVNTLKGGRRRSIPLDAQLLVACRWCARESGGGRSARRPLLRTRTGGMVHQRNLRRRWVGWCKDCLGRPVRYHDLRHSMAHYVYRRSGDIFAVQRLLGHRKIETTHLYLKSLKDMAAWLPGADDGTSQ